MTNAEITTLRELTASQMTCDCGEPLAMTAQGLVCPSAKCIGRATREVKLPYPNSLVYRIGMFVTNAQLSRAWPERVVEHDRPFRTRLKDWSEGLNAMGGSE